MLDARNKIAFQRVKILLDDDEKWKEFWKLRNFTFHSILVLQNERIYFARSYSLGKKKILYGPRIRIFIPSFLFPEDSFSQLSCVQEFLFNLFHNLCINHIFFSTFSKYE